MATRVTQSVSAVAIRLTEERWAHILRRHPQLSGREHELPEALSSADLILEGDQGTLQAAKRVDRLYLVVIYREISGTDGFVVTAFEA